MERMMKLQEVILKAIARKLTWMEAAEIAGMSVRNLQRMRQRYREYGYNGLLDQRRGKRSYHQACDSSRISRMRTLATVTCSLRKGI
jgi:transposase